MGKANKTTISLKPATRDRMKSLKRGGESYNSVVRKLLSEYDSDG